MKNNFKIFAFILISAVLFNSCMGSFTLTKKVYSWNKTVGDKYLNELVFLVMNFIPIYPFVLIVDGVILNSIEFWTGDNPLAMNENDIQKQVVSMKGKFVEITATKNQFSFRYLEGKKTGTETIVRFNEKDLSWELHANGTVQKLSKHSPYNKTIKVIANKNSIKQLVMPF